MCTAVLAFGLVMAGHAGRAAVAQDWLEQRFPGPTGSTAPRAREKKAAPMPQTGGTGRRALIPFRNAPFPYRGKVPATGKPFLDVVLEDRSGHTARSGIIYWADETYSDSRVLAELAPGFTTARPGLLVVFLHGNGATLERDVIARQQVPRQVAAAGLNSVLIAPQLAFDALDSSAGKFWQPGTFTAFLDEAAGHLARLAGDQRARRYFRDLPIVIIGYSGGYHPLAYILHHGSPGERVIGIVLLDATYGDLDKFSAWMTGRDGGFLVSAFTSSTADGNAELQRLLAHRGIAAQTALQPVLGNRDAVFMATPPAVNHTDFVTLAWAADPVRDLLARIPGYSRKPAR